MGIQCRKLDDDNNHSRMQYEACRDELTKETGTPYLLRSIHVDHWLIPITSYFADPMGGSCTVPGVSFSMLPEDAAQQCAHGLSILEKGGKQYQATAWLPGMWTVAEKK